MSERQRISRARAIESKCHRCSCEYFDGKMDCEITDCPLYSFMPYRRLKPNLEWQQYSPRRRGLVSLDEIIKQKPHKNEVKNRLNESVGGSHTEGDQRPERSQETGSTEQEGAIL